MWLWLCRNSASSVLSRLLSGMKTAGRSSGSRSIDSIFSPKYLSKSFASRMPTTSSRSSPITGKREWPDSTIVLMRLSSGSAFSRTTICERGTMMSRTWVCETSSTPWSIAYSSAASKPRWRLSARNAAISSRPLSSSARPWNRRAHQPVRPGPSLVEGKSSDIEWVVYWGLERVHSRRPDGPLGLVRVAEAELGEDLPLASLHDVGVRIVLVVVADEVQRPVHDQMGEMRLERLALLGRLALDDRRADDDIAERRRLVRGQRHIDLGGKRQDVRRADLAAVTLVQRRRLALAD